MRVATEGTGGCRGWPALLVLSLATLLTTRGAALQAPLVIHGRTLEFASDNLIVSCSADSAALDDSSVTKIGRALATISDSTEAEAFSRIYQDSLRWWADSVRRMLVLAREHDDNTLAARYAPILRFAPGERFFPTLPFYSAFDSTSNPVSTDTLMDRVLPMQSMRLDRATYAWAQVGKDRSVPIRRRVWHGTTWDRRPSLSSLQRRYLGSLRKAGAQSSRPVAAVLYRVCDLTAGGHAPAHRRALSLLGASQELPPSPKGQDQVSDVWRYLKGDEQAWHRYGLDTLVSPAKDTSNRQERAESDSCDGLSEATPMRAVEYFLYYLADRGLEGHPHDLESVIVFVPRERQLARCLRIVVGAGHKDPAPNNVLVFVGEAAGNPRFEQQNVLVEFGGHSSAPDMPPFGQFSAGLDVNWHVDELWGTRDKQASAGVEYHGRYEGGMTYPREPEDAVTILPNVLDTSSRALLEPLVRLPQAKLAKRVLDYYRDTLAIKRAEADEFADQQRRASQELEDLTSRVLTRYQSVTKDWLGYERPGRDSLFVSQQGDSSLRGSDLAEVRADAIASLLSSISSPKIEEPDSAAREIATLLRSVAVRGSAVGRQEATLREAIKAKLRIHVPPADSVDTLKTLVSILQHETDAKLLPLYSLVPIEHLRRLYQSARESDTLRTDPLQRVMADAAADTASKYFRLVVLSLRGTRCPLQHQPGCDLMGKDGAEFDPVYDGYAGCLTTYDVGCLLNSGDGDSKAEVVHRIAAWDTGGLWDTRGGRKSARRISDKKRYKPWEHELYHSPTDIFRPHLFRPNTLQTKGDFPHLFTGGLTLAPRSAAMPHLGIIVPAIPGLPAKVPGYVEVQVGPYLSWTGHGATRTSFAGSLLYASRYAYFWGWFVKGTFITSRNHVERRDDTTWFTLSAGPTFWFPFGVLKPLHWRAGLRFDVNRWTPKLSTAAWDLEIDLHQ